MELPLDPNMALEGLHLGSCKQAVRDFFQGGPQTFQRTPHSNEGDYWPDLGVFAYYDDAEALEALELTAPARPMLSGHTLTSLPFQKAKQLLQRLDHEVEIDSDGAISKKFGIGLWSGAGAHGAVDAVIRFVPGYYD